MEKVIAVIVTYNRIKLLKECLNAVLSQTYKVHKIVLIDNGWNRRFVYKRRRV